MPKKLQSIYELLKDYSKEELDNVLNMLNENDKELLMSRYGNDLDNPKKTSEWNTKLNNRFYCYLLPKLKKLLSQQKTISFAPEENIECNESKIDSSEIESIEMKNADLNNSDSNDTEVDSTLKVEDNKHDNPVNEPNILPLLNLPSFDQMLKYLNKLEAIIVLLRIEFGYETKDIAKFFKISEEEVREITTKVLLLYRDSINDIVDNFNRKKFTK